MTQNPHHHFSGEPASPTQSFKLPTKPLSQGDLHRILIQQSHPRYNQSHHQWTSPYIPRYLFSASLLMSKTSNLITKIEMPQAISHSIFRENYFEPVSTITLLHTWPLIPFFNPATSHLVRKYQIKSNKIEKAQTRFHSPKNPILNSHSTVRLSWSSQ